MTCPRSGSSPRRRAPGHPLTLGRGLEEDPGGRPRAQPLGEAPRLGADPALDEFASVSQNADLTFLLVHVDANMVHGRPLL